MPGELSLVLFVLEHVRFILDHFKFHFFAVLSAKLSVKEVKVLYKMVILGPISSYRLSQECDLPSATAWRILKKLAKEGYVKMGYRSFYITPKGLIAVFRSEGDERIKRLVSIKLKEEWKYEGSDSEIYTFLNEIVKLSDEGRFNVDNLCFNHPTSLAAFLYPFADDLSDTSKKIIAFYMLKIFPPIPITPSCRGVIGFRENGEPYAIAMDCTKEGLRLNFSCECIKRMVCTNSNLTKKQ
ncbi:hypothetical protein [Stygiolobus caldivivus]|uniref:Uncharacterized protein n=1 Tax=Stygiolobus caldivivus TaxID=2824673 RepID=A0A8D5U7S4_9CREN|nr:hypothetical protein [Stygiolobus caldivivus]BCU70909.1 hypothetical protein KN1_22060 [Stygiolobus caldivivus]